MKFIPHLPAGLIVIDPSVLGFPLSVGCLNAGDNGQKDNEQWVAMGRWNSNLQQNRKMKLNTYQIDSSGDELLNSIVLRVTSTIG